MSFLDFLANGTWDGYSATDDGSPGFPGTGQNITMQGMDVNTTQYVGTAANSYTLVINDDPNNPTGEALFLDDGVHANQNGLMNQPFLVGIKTITLTGSNPVLIDLTSTQFAYTPLTIHGANGTYTLLGNGGYDTFTIGDGAFDAVYVTMNYNNIHTGNGIQDAIWTGANSSNDTLAVGNGEEDHIYVTSGNHDVLSAGNGDYNILTVDGEGNSYDKLTSGNGWGVQLTINDGTHNALKAGDGNFDILTTGNGDWNSQTVGNGYGNTLTAGNGNDTTLVAGNGHDDVLTIGAGNGNGAFAGDGDRDIVTIGQGNGDWVVVGDGANDAVTLAGGNSETIQAGNGVADMVTVGAGSGDYISVGNGAGDVVSLASGSWNTVVLGNGIGDLATIGNGSENTIYGGTGNNAVLTIGAGSYNTIIVPDGATTYSYGGNGGGCGGCCGGGSFSVTVTHGANPTGDILTIGAGNYNAIYSSDGANSTLILGAGSHNYASTGDGAGDVVYVGDGSSNVVQGGAGYDTIYGGNGENNTLIAGNGGSLIYTGTGNDTVVGGKGNDTIVVGLHTETTSTTDPTHLKTTDGEAQHITLGSNGTDAVLIQGGTTANAGTEVITAGAQGHDTFYFGGVFGDTVISGFNAAQDKLMLAGVTTGSLGSMPVDQFTYVHSAYSTDHNQNDKNDLLITIGGGTSGTPASTITLLNFASQDPSHLFNNTTINPNTVAGLTALSKLFDFSTTDQQTLLTGVDLSHQAHHYGV